MVIIYTKKHGRAEGFVASTKLTVATGRVKGEINLSIKLSPTARTWDKTDHLQL